MAFSECPSFPIRPDRSGLEKAGAIDGLRIAPTRSSTMSGRNKRLSMHHRELRESIRAYRAGDPATSTPGMTSAAAGAAAASRSSRSSKPRSTGSTGSIIACCSSPSATSHPPMPKTNTMLPQTSSIWLRNARPTASDKPGAVQNAALSQNPSPVRNGTRPTSDRVSDCKGGGVRFSAAFTHHP